MSPILKRSLFGAKAVLSVGLLWYVWEHLALADAIHRASQISPWWLVSTFVLFYIQMGLAAVRYREMLVVLDQRLPLRASLDAVLVGYFFSQTMISFVGGDAMRALRTAQAGIPWSTTTKAVVLDRLSGFAGQIVLLLLVIPFLLPRLPTASMRHALLGVIAVAAVGVFILAVLSRLPQIIQRVRLMEMLGGLSQRILRRMLSWHALLTFLGLSTLINALNCVIYYLIARGLSIDVSMTDLLILMPPVFFLSMLPVSISGWGIREGGTVMILGLAGVSATDSLVISICFGLGLLLISLPGALVWLTTKPAAREVTAN